MSNSSIKFSIYLFLINLLTIQLQQQQVHCTYTVQQTNYLKNPLIPPPPSYQPAESETAAAGTITAEAFLPPQQHPIQRQVHLTTDTILPNINNYDNNNNNNNNDNNDNNYNEKGNINIITNTFEVVNEWKYLDFEYPTFVQRKRAIANREFIPENNLPLGIDVYRDRIFITTPRWKDGVPASFGVLSYPALERSPAIRPYPNWTAHGDPYNPDCSKLISVYRTSIDKCGRLWLIDSGIVNATVKLNQICPPKIVAFDLNTDEMIVSYELPPDQVKQDSLHSNILVDVHANRCQDAHVYVTDVWRFGIVVYSLSKNRSWRVTNYNFSPNPIASDFNVYGLNFQWLDGVFGMSLSLEEQHPDNQERILYFHPMASYKEFVVSTALLQDESLWPASAQDVSKYFVEIGDRGVNGQSSTSGIARNGVMFFTQVHRDDIACWDTQKPYRRSNLATLVNGKKSEDSSPLIQFPNDLKVDQEDNQGVWVMSNRLPIYLYSQLDYSDVNFRILRANAKDIVEGTICDPRTKSNTQTNIRQVEEGQCF